MRYRGFVVAVVVLLGTGCGRKVVKSSLPNMVIPVNCASEILLVRCDMRVSPPKCSKAVVKYRIGCERILVGR